MDKQDDDLLAWVLRQFEVTLSEPLPDNNNFPPELPAALDPSTDEYAKNDNDTNS